MTATSISEPTFTAVFRTPYEVFGRLPWAVADRPPFQFERLHGGMGDELIGLAFAEFVGATGDEPPDSLQGVCADLLENAEDGVVVSGGIRVTAGDSNIIPGCCCGVEAFGEWVTSYKTHESPWMGHDPNGWIEWHDDVATIWRHRPFPPDNDSPRPPPDGFSISVPRTRFAEQLEQVRHDLIGFSNALEAWLAARGIAEARAVVELFERPCRFRKPLGIV